MVKAPLYTLMLLTNIHNFGITSEHKNNFEEAMSAFLFNESYHLLKALGINHKLEGWERLLRDKCLQNELMDIKNINAPMYSKDLRDKDYFIFSAYLKPGYHQLLIYDPQLERAFCKDFVLNLNQRGDIFPEYPLS